MNDQDAKSPFILGINPLTHSVFNDTETMLYQVGENTGNLVFIHAINQQFGGDLRQIDRRAMPDNIEKYGDLAVVPCANHLGNHEDLGDLVDKFKTAQVGMVAIGLGAQQSLGQELPVVPQGTIDWVKSIINHAPTSAPNISVRGFYTLKVLEKYGLSNAAVVLGCPSLFINPDPGLGQKISHRRHTNQGRVCVISGDVRLQSLAKIEASLASIVTAKRGAYILQSSRMLMEICRGEAVQGSESQLSRYRDYIVPDLSLSKFISWLKIHAHVFFNIPGWMEFYRRFDFVVGTRFHGVALAIQAGIPGMCIVHDSRTLELCQLMKVPYVLAEKVVNGFDYRDLVKEFEFDPDSFDSNRLALAQEYKRFLVGNRLAPKFGLLN